MALSIDTCNDIEKYEEAVIAGMNAKKSIMAIIAVACGGIVTLMLSLLLHLELILCIYAATPVTGLIIVLGFDEKDGMSLFQRMKNKSRKNQDKPICYMSTETKAEYEKHGKAETAAKTKEEVDAEFEKIKKMAVFGGIGAAALVILIIVLLVVIL